MAEQTLHGKNAWITGAAGGLGLGMAKRLEAAGAHITLVDINEEKGQQALKELTNADFHQVDVTDEAAVEASLKRVADEHGGVHIVINNAGIDGKQQKTDEMDSDNWHAVINLNLNAAFYGLKHGIRQLKAAGGGCIVNTASTAGLVAFENIIPYGASKAGIIAMTKTAAVECAPHNIRVNAVAPAVVKTDLVEHFIESAEDPQAMREMFQNMNPYPGMVTVEAVAEAVYYLVSPASDFVTGHTLPIDGAYTVK